MNNSIFRVEPIKVYPVAGGFHAYDPVFQSTVFGATKNDALKAMAIARKRNERLEIIAVATFGHKHD